MSDRRYLVEIEDLHKEVMFVCERQKNLRIRVPVIANLNLRIEKGETVGLVGLPGCGKSILVDLMTKKIYPDKGKIKIEGQNIRRIRKKHLKIKSVFNDPTFEISSSSYKITIEKIFKNDDLSELLELEKEKIQSDLFANLE